MRCMRWNSEKGAAVVEFAVILPLLLVILFGIIEFGFLMYNQAMITNAAREGARAGIVIQTPRMSTADITNEVDKYLQNFLVTFSSGAPPDPTVVVKVDGVEADPSVVGLTSAQSYVTVEVTFDYEFLILPNFVKTLGLTKTMFASATMRAE
jgi:Flp pilus assembly protein TadG